MFIVTKLLNFKFSKIDVSLVPGFVPFCLSVVQFGQISDRPVFPHVFWMLFGWENLCNTDVRFCQSQIYYSTRWNLNLLKLLKSDLKKSRICSIGVILAHSDSGPVMPKHQVPSVFIPFGPKSDIPGPYFGPTLAVISVVDPHLTRFRLPLN